MSPAELQAGDTAEVILVVAQEDATVGQTDTSDQAVRHADALPLRLKLKIKRVIATQRPYQFFLASLEAPFSVKQPQSLPHAEHLISVG